MVFPRDQVGYLELMPDLSRLAEDAPTDSSPPTRLEAWMDGYIQAWSSNDPDQIASLFTEDAVYDPQTADGEIHGATEISAWWRDQGDEAENWDFEWLPLVETEDLGIITGRTRYLAPPTSYRNLWVIRFAEDGRCYDFTEWYIEEDEVG